MKKYFSFTLMIFVYLVLFAGVAAAANYPLEIIQPQEGLDIKNRFYKAYPGLEYNVRVAVIGGLFPITYTLETGPSGMSIDAATGVISWPNPTEAGSPHSVTVKVVDDEGSVDTHTWSITVTTQGFKFLDAVNGKTVANGGTGTIDNPWRTLGDMYEGNDYSAKYASSYSGNFLYFKSGTYLTSTAFIENGNRIPLTNYRKPLVWLAYPGHSPVLDMSAGSITIYEGANNVYVDGLEVSNIANSQGKGWDVSSSGNNVSFVNNDFHKIIDQHVTNQAFIFVIREGAGQYWSFKGNKFHDAPAGSGIMAYKIEKTLVEDNEFYDIVSHALGPKMSYRYWFIRDNLFYACDGWSIWADGYTNYGPTEHVDVSFNLVRTAGKYAFQANFDDGNMGVIYVYRNTFVGPVGVRFADIGRGPFNFYKNVIVNNANGLTCWDCRNSSVMINNDNLTGNIGDGIVDSSGLLSESYSQYIGRYGHQVPNVGLVVPPGSPEDFKKN